MTGCLIRNNERAGVWLWNTPARNADVCDDNLIENNRILRCRIGVGIKNAGRNRVERNEIADLERGAVEIGSIRFHALWAMGPSAYPEGFSWDTRYDYLHSRDNLVAHNHVHHVCLDSSDVGAVGGWGTGWRTTGSTTSAAPPMAESAASISTTPPTPSRSPATSFTT